MSLGSIETLIENSNGFQRTMSPERGEGEAGIVRKWYWRSYGTRDGSIWSMRCPEERSLVRGTLLIIF
jgi:hypothetical protein